MEACDEQNSKRHRAAALQDADAPAHTPLLPRGLGVQQPYAAFVAQRRAAPFFGLMLLWSLDSSYVGCYEN